MQTLICKLKLKKNEYLFLRRLSKCSKNVYNATLYEIKHNYETNGKFLDYRSICRILKNKLVYKKCHANISQHSMQRVNEAYKSFFASIKLKIGGTRPPKFLPKTGIGNSSNLIAKLSSGCVKQPCRIRMDQIHQTSAMKLINMLISTNSL